MVMALTEEEKLYLEDDTPQGPLAITAEEKAYVDNVPPPAPPEPTMLEQGLHIAKGLGQGIIDETVDLPYNLRQMGGTIADFTPDVVKSAVSKIPVVQAANKLSEYYPDALQGKVKFSDLPGLKQAKAMFASEEENVPEGSAADVARTGAEWLVGGGPKIVRNVAEEGLKSIPKLFKGTQDDVIMASGAAGGQAVGNWFDEESGGDVGELIGGLGGLVVALKTGKVEGLSPEQRKMLTRLREQFDNPDEAIAAVEARIAQGEIGTLADLSRDRNVANVEAAIENTPQGSKALPKTLEARTNQIYDETMEPFKTGVHPEHGTQAAELQVNREVRQTMEAANKVQEATGEETKRLSQAVDAQAKEVQAAAEAANKQAEAAAARAVEVKDVVDPGARPDEFSSGAAGKYNAAETAHADNVSKPAWKAFDDGPDIEVKPLQDAAGEVLFDLTAEELKVFRDKYGSELANIGSDSWRGPVSPRAISLRIQQMKDKINKAIERGENGWEEKQLSLVVERLEKTLAQPIVSPEYAKAVAATKEGYDRFGPAYIGDVRKANKKTPETLVTNLGLRGDRGAATARLIKESKVPELQDDVAKYVKAQAVRAKNLDDQFLIEYEAVLDNLPPSVRGEIVSLIDARAAEDVGLTQATAADKAAETTTTQAAAEQSRLTKSLEADLKTQETATSSLVEALRGDVRAQYGKGFEEADALIDDLLTRSDGPDKLQMLVDDLAEMDAGDASLNSVASLKTKVGERLDSQLFDLLTVTGKEGRKAKMDSLQKFRDMRRRLVDTGLLDGEQAKYLDDVLERTQSDILRRQASARVGDLSKSDSDQSNLLASALSAILLAPLPGGYNLQLGGAVRRNFKSMLEVEPTKRNVDALVEYLNDPEQFLIGLDKLKTPRAQSQAFLTKLVGASQAAEIIGGE